MCSIVQGYLIGHIVSTKLAIVITGILSYCAILNHPITVLVIVAAFIIRYFLFIFLCIV